MNEQSQTQVIDFFSVAKNVGIANNIQALAEEGVVNSRATYLKFNAVAKDNLKTYHDAITAALAATRAIGERVVLNAEANTKAAFDAAEAISRAKTWSEITQLQSRYMQKQAGQMSAQTNELCELSMKVAQRMLEAANSTTAKTFDAVRKVG